MVPRGFGVDEEGVIRFTGDERELADSHAAGGGEVDFVLGLHRPTAGAEHGVDLLAGFFLGGHGSEANDVSNGGSRDILD